MRREAGELNADGPGDVLMAKTGKDKVGGACRPAFHFRVLGRLTVGSHEPSWAEIRLDADDYRRSD